MFSIGTEQNKDNLLLSFSSVEYGTLHTKALGVIPIFLKSFTLFWVGFVFNSPEPNNNGISVQWTKKVFSFPSSYWICLNASINGWLSISPTVPPISVITISALLESPASKTLFFISFVIWGTIWTVDPKYSPLLSFSITLL